MSHSTEKASGAAGGPPPAYASPVQTPAQSPVMVVQPVVVYGQRNSFRTQCPFCKAQIATRCNAVMSSTDIIMIIVGLLVFLPLICIVACCSPWSDYEHFCPNCGQFLGRSNSGI